MLHATHLPPRVRRASSRWRTAPLLAFCVALPIACGPDPVAPLGDGGVLEDPAALDAGSGEMPADGGPFDAGREPPLPDAGSTTPPDAGHATDAGAPMDASEPTDGGARLDASELPDGGGGSDASVLPDAGARMDAGDLLDAGASSDAAVFPDAGEPADAGAAPPGIGATCFPEIFDASLLGPDYDQFSPVVGSHCYGTNHQDITGIERVVFLGDSVTVGSPPTLSVRFYRAQLAERLATHFGLTPPDLSWRLANPFTGESAVRESGDFASCARWGARTDDLLENNTQLEDCLPEDKRHLRTLVIMTVGGNDVAQVAKSGAHAPYDDSWVQVQAYVERMRTAVEWLKEPGRFPNGVHVVFANTYEFTDGTADVESCPAVGLGDYVGFDTGFEAWDHPEWLKDFIVWANEQYMQIAVDTGSDMLFLFEHFCGHGFRSDDPTGPCYRGPDTERWFDLTCIHPTPTGHTRIADMFMEIVLE